MHEHPTDNASEIQRRANLRSGRRGKKKRDPVTNKLLPKVSYDDDPNAWEKDWAEQVRVFEETRLSKIVNDGDDQK